MRHDTCICCNESFTAPFRLLDVLPCPAQDDGAHSGLNDSEVRTYNPLEFTGSASRPDLSNVVVGKFCVAADHSFWDSLGVSPGTVAIPARNSLWMGPRTVFISRCSILFASITALRKHVFHVHILISKKQMVRIAASRVVALMKNKHSVRDRPIGENPRNPVSANHPSDAVNGDDAISGVIGSPYPLKAITTAFKPGKQSIFSRGPIGIRGGPIAAADIFRGNLVTFAGHAGSYLRDRAGGESNRCPAFRYPNYTALSLKGRLNWSVA